MIKLFVAVAAIVVASSAAWADNARIVAKKSPHSVAATLDRLTDVLATRGITVAARVDHAAAAQKVGQSLKPTQVLIFGNPKLGTPLMQSKRTVGLDLPMKVLAWEDEDGQVWLAYVKPEALRSDHAITDRDDAFREMAQALTNLTDAAVKEK